MIIIILAASSFLVNEQCQVALRSAPIFALTCRQCLTCLTMAGCMTILC